MAISRAHTWSAGEVLLASDLNAEFNNVLNNASDLVSPFTKAASMGGFALNFDAANTIALIATTSGISLTGGTLREPAEDSITAFATGGQSSATALSLAKKYHRISTCATTADSVKLPASSSGQAHFIRNDGAAATQVFGTSPDTINGVATGTGVPLPPGTASWYVCTTSGNWISGQPPVSVSGNFSVTFTATATTAVTLPTSGTLATLAGTESLTNKTITIKDVNFTVQDDGDTTKQAKFQLSGLTTGTTRTITLSDYDVTIGNMPSGVIMDYAGSSLPTGWLECDGSAVSRTTYANLFTAVSTTWGTGDGSTTFNVPDFRGRARLGKGTGTATASGVNGDVDTTGDTLAVASNNTKWITGQAVVFTLASGTITGLSSGSTYYIIRSSSTLVQLASSLANAQNGTQIDLTAKSSPVWTITATLTSRTLGEQGGEETHAQSITELLNHNHATNLVTGIANAGALGLAGGGSAATQTANTAAGGNVAMNTMQPFAITMAIIKT